MSKRKCVGLVMGSFIGGMINSLTHTISLGRLSFCGSNVVGHFFCDVPPLLKLSCSDTSLNELLLLIFSGVIAMATFLIVIISYIFIAAAILRICSAAGRQKAFSTCASHLIAMTIFYGTLSFNYIQPSSQYSVEQEKVVSVFYTLVIPMLNPLIYSLRNRGKGSCEKGHRNEAFPLLISVHLIIQHSTSYSLITIHKNSMNSRLFKYCKSNCILYLFSHEEVKIRKEK